MKIEKLTENKIRIIIKSEDIEDENIDLHTIMTKTAESQGILLEILNKAKQEVGFDTDGCRLLIEAYSSLEDTFVFTVTKYNVDNEESNHLQPKRIVKVKRKTFSDKSDNYIYRFENFDTFCGFCELLQKNRPIYSKGLIGLSSLYLFKDNYFLVLKHVNNSHKYAKKFNSYISEFSKLIFYSDVFENKLKEYGKIIMKKNAISTGIKYFCK